MRDDMQPKQGVPEMGAGYGSGPDEMGSAPFDEFARSLGVDRGNVDAIKAQMRAQQQQAQMAAQQQGQAQMAAQQQQQVRMSAPQQGQPGMYQATQPWTPAHAGQPQRAPQPSDGHTRISVAASAPNLILEEPITEDMLRSKRPKHAREDADISNYTSADRYSGDRIRRKQRRYTKVISAILAAFLIICAASGIYLATIFATGQDAQAASQADMHQQKWGATESDIEMMAAEGYDAEALTDSVEGFCKAFFTFDKDTVEDGSWLRSFEPYVVPQDELVAIQENLIYVREGEGWESVFEAHPYFLSRLVSCNRISWSILPTSTVNVPYCDVYIELDRCPITRYVLNSPSFVINSYLDRYRIVFDADGKITSCKKMNSRLIEEDVDEAAVAADAAVYEKATADAKKKAEELRRKALEEQARADAAAKAKAEADAKAAEEERLRAEEEEKAKEEAEAEGAGTSGTQTPGGTSNAGGTSSGTTPSNPGGSSGGGSGNTGGSSGNTGGSSNPGGNTSGGNTGSSGSGSGSGNTGSSGGDGGAAAGPGGSN